MAASVAEPLPPAPWGTYELEDGSDNLVEIGPLRLRIRQKGDEIRLAHAWTEDAVGRPAPNLAPLEGDDVEWTRWAVPEQARGIRLWPTLADRPLVVRPESAFHVVRGAKVRIYVRVPLHVRIELAGSSTIPLAVIPTRILSDTWFGDFMEGELTYFLATTARRRVLPEDFEPNVAICPVRLSNASVDDLEVEKIALRVAHLSLFALEKQLWADETTIRYRGAEEGSDLRMAGKAPAEAEGAVLLTPPQIPVARGFRARTFARFINLSGFGSAS